MLRHSNLEVINILRQEGAYGKGEVDAEDPYKSRIRLNARDLANLRHRARRLLLRGRTPTAALLMGLPGWDVFYKETKGATRQVEHIFCASHSGLDILARFPSILWIDATYKTNCFKMPMIDIIGRSANGKTFFVACAFVSNEKEGTYRWVLKTLQDLLEKHQIPYPTTTFSDDEESLLAAMATVFPNTTALLCVWHIQ